MLKTSRPSVPTQDVGPITTDRGSRLSHLFSKHPKEERRPSFNTSSITQPTSSPYDPAPLSTRPPSYTSRLEPEGSFTSSFPNEKARAPSFSSAQPPAYSSSTSHSGDTNNFIGSSPEFCHNSPVVLHLEQETIVWKDDFTISTTTGAPVLSFHLVLDNAGKHYDVLLPHSPNTPALTVRVEPATIGQPNYIIERTNGPRAEKIASIFGKAQNFTSANSLDIHFANIAASAASFPREKGAPWVDAPGTATLNIVNSIATSDCSLLATLPSGEKKTIAHTLKESKFKLKKPGTVRWNLQIDAGVDIVLVAVLMACVLKRPTEDASAERGRQAAARDLGLHTVPNAMTFGYGAGFCGVGGAGC